MVVVNILGVNHHVTHLIGALLHRKWSDHADGLPQKGKYQQQRSQTVGHAFNCRSRSVGVEFPAELSSVFIKDRTVESISLGLAAPAQFITSNASSMTDCASPCVLSAT